MDHEIIAKLRVLASCGMSEADVQHAFVLLRKLLERLPHADSQRSALLRFYCDWTVHSKIDRSGAGAVVLSRVHNLLVDQLNGDSSVFVRELTAALSLEALRGEINELFQRYDGQAEVFNRAQWDLIVPHVAEIISQCPLAIADNKNLRPIREAIQTRPVKGTAVVEELAVIKVASTVFKREAPVGETTFCVQLRLTDTTRIIAPMVRV